MAFLFRRAQQAAGPTPPPPWQPHPHHSSASRPASDVLIQPALSAYISGNKSSLSGSDSVVQKGTLATVAKSIRHCVSGMSPWDISDLTLGLYKIATRHALEGVSDTIEGYIVSDKQELEEILYWLDWAWASYLADEKAIVEFLKIQEHQLKKHVNTSAILNPVYCVAVDDAKKCVVLSIRGTYAAADVLTDLQPHSEKFEGGYAHSGILSAARWILENENDNLQILLSQNVGYKLIITGHSLGAGAACLLTYLLRESVGSRNKRISSRLGISSSMIECWGYGCPPCVDKELCETAPFIKNIVLQDDVVARASVAALEDLRSEILQTNWADVLEDGGIAKKMLNLVNRTNSRLGNVEQALGYESGTFYQQAKNAMVESFQAAVVRARSGPPGNFGPPGYYAAPNHCWSGGPPPRPPQSLAGWMVSYGAAAISSYLNTPEGNPSLAGSSRDFMEGGRLYVPGVLYHVKRTALEGSISSASVTNNDLQVVATAANRSSSTYLNTAAGRVSTSNAVAGTAPIPMRHTVIKGSNPQSRFMKIILSKSLLSDHGLGAYKDGIKDAINANQEV